GFDGLLVMKPDGRIAFQSGIGNLGTESVIDVHRVAAEILGVPWEKCDIVWGDTSKNLPFTCVSGGSQTTHAMTRAAHAVAMAARQRLQEIAAKSLGGSPKDYEVANGRVFRKEDGGAGMTLAQAGERAMQLGDIEEAHEAPNAGHWQRDRPEVGVRPPLRHHGVDTVLPQQAANDSGCTRQHAVGSAGHSGSGDAGRRSWHWRAARWRWVCLHLERSLGRTWGRDLPARSGEPRHHPDVAGSRAAHATSAAGPHLMEA